MFTIPSPEEGLRGDIDERKDGLCVITGKVPESTDVTIAFTLLCYPEASFSLNLWTMDIDTLMATLAATDKYDMQEARFRGRRLMLPHISADPMRVFALACHFHLMFEAKLAAW